MAHTLAAPFTTGFAPNASSTRRTTRRHACAHANTVVLRAPMVLQRSSSAVQPRLVMRSADVQDVASSSSTNDEWVPVCLPEELPKGVRKEVEVDGRQVLLFWYRNQIYAIGARSPAEGAYSEGFIKAKFTQDYCIECPSTGSLFSLKDGSIVSWYPNNPVLRAVTPQSTCRKLEIFPVKLAQDAIYVDVSNSRFASANMGRGGMGTSIENNNVFTVQPTVYFEGMDPTKESASVLQVGPTQEGVNPAVAITATVAVGSVAVAGTAIAIYNENVAALVAFWAILGGAAVYTGYQYLSKQDKK